MPHAWNCRRQWLIVPLGIRRTDQLRVLDETWIVHTAVIVSGLINIADLRVKARIWSLWLQQSRVIRIKRGHLLVAMIILLMIHCLLTPARWLLHQHLLPILSAASQVVEASRCLTRCLMLMLIVPYVSLLYRCVLCSLLIHVQQFIIMLARATTTRINL